jgi:hypothetical protein
MRLVAVFIIQIRNGLAVILVWIQPGPHQNIGGGFSKQV